MGAASGAGAGGVGATAGAASLPHSPHRGCAGAAAGRQLALALRHLLSAELRQLRLRLAAELRLRPCTPPRSTPGSRTGSSPTSTTFLKPASREVKPTKSALVPNVSRNRCRIHNLLQSLPHPQPFAIANASTILKDVDNLKGCGCGSDCRGRRGPPAQTLSAWL